MEVTSNMRTETPWAEIIGFAQEISVTEWDRCKGFSKVEERSDFMGDLPEPKNYIMHRKNTGGKPGKHPYTRESN